MRRLVALFTLASMGCYSYVRPPGPTPPVGGEIQIELTDAGVVAMAPLVGPNVTILRGRVTAATEDSLSLAMQSVTKRNRGEEYWAGEPITVARSHVATLGVRKASAWRSGLFVGVVAAGVIAVTTAIVRNIGAGGGDSPKPPPGQ
ncbi:MAG: hypothetical protein ABIS15_01800 [Gemmatimonadaceae bacterium]